MGAFAEAAAGAASGLLGSILNYVATRKTNESNEKINQRNLDYNAAMTREQWERDDTAHQREVADLKAAGLSPLANMTGTDTSQALGAPSPIAMQAPQVDVNALIQSVLGSQQLEEQKREFNVSSGQKDMQIANDAKKIEIESKQIDLQDKKLNNEFSIATEQNTLRSKEIENFKNELEEVKRHNKESERRAEEERLFNEYSERTRQLVEDAQKNCPEFVGGIKWCFSADELETAQQSYNNTMSALIKELNSIKNADSSTYGKLDGGVIAGIPGLGKVGVDADVNSGYTKDLSDKRKAIINKYKAQLKMPRLVSYEDRDMFDDNGNLKYKRN